MNLLQGAYKELMEEEDNESIILGGRHLELDENGENVFGQNQDEINNFDYSNLCFFPSSSFIAFHCCTIVILLSN